MTSSCLCSQTVHIAKENIAVDYIYSRAVLNPIAVEIKVRATLGTDSFLQDSVSIKLDF